MSGGPLIIGTRGSRLALWQADHIAERLQQAGIASEQRIIKTKGDRIQDLSFDKLEGKGFFTKEIEQELLAGTIDLAVHSCKDLETRDPEGLHIAAIAGRAACEELLLIRPEAVDLTRPLMLKQQAIVGTSSARRKSQLRLFRPDVRIEDLRGNVPTRVDKLRSGAFDAILLAKAGIDRLGLDLAGLHVRTLDARWFVPAPAQGALAVQSRADDAAANAAAEKLHDAEAASCAALERSVLFGYRGGCQVPLGVHAVKHASGFQLWASAARVWEETPRRIHLKGADANTLSADAVRRLQGPIKPLHVVITREVNDNDLMGRSLSAHGITLTGTALFQAEAIVFTVPADHDRIFFTSRNAVRFFVQGGGRIDHVSCDAFGEGTAEELRKFGVEPSFIGDGPDPTSIAKTYAEHFGQQRVLFPCAARGSRTVQRAMPAANVIDLEVYAMRPVAQDAIPQADAFIITSPDNAEALLQRMEHLDATSIIAMGTATSQKVKELAGVNAILPWASNEMALIDAVLTLATDQSWS